ncbi:MAG TPA: hypothetical protein VJR87_03920 [Allosphingosinicella sp.]|nr:hypothetical protein [Allosphingosinicella sp.]
MTIRTALMAGVLLLPGCSSLSFAPPRLKYDMDLRAEGGAASVLQYGCPAVMSAGGHSNLTIRRDVAGAQAMIDNFVLTYRCAAHSAANGRQYFEIPAFLALAGTSAAVAFGAGPDTAIAGGVGNALFTSGGKYFAPKDKAGILDHSLDALLCIKTEAVGIDAFALDAISNVEEASGATANAVLKAMRNGSESGEVTVSSSEQYFEMVVAALFSVERVTAQRLSAAGTPFDAAGVVAEIEALHKKTDPPPAEQEQEAAGADAAAEALIAPAAELPATGSVLKGMQLESFNKAAAAAWSAKLALVSLPKTRISETILKLKDLQPKLQKCVIRAKV